MLDEWIITQQKYLYLDGIFSEDEIRVQLREAISKFSIAEIQYRELMGQVIDDQNVYRLCTTENRLNCLQQLNLKLDELQKMLKAFLYTKRQKCTRLFFISDDELLEILGKGTNPLAIKRHLSTIFDRLQDTICSPERDSIIGLQTVAGEQLPFRQPVSVSGHRPLELWISEVIAEMQSAVRYLIKKAVLEYSADDDQTTGSSREQWFREFPTEVIVTANNIWWTLEVEEVFLRMRSGNVRAMKELLAAQNRDLDKNLRRIREENGEMSELDRLKWRLVTTADIQLRDYVEQFVKRGVSSPSDFEWDRQLRFYWIKEFDNVVVVQCFNRFMFGNEFLGLASRLIVTSLTERIWLSITQCLAVNQNCMLIGPAGVGKTETVKELAHTMGYLCHVVSCQEETDYVTCLARVLCGVVQSGTWCCFDDLHKVRDDCANSLGTSIARIRNALVDRRYDVEVSESIVDCKD